MVDCLVGRVIIMTCIEIVCVLPKRPWPCAHCVQPSPCVFEVPSAELTFSPFTPVLEWVLVVFGQGLLWLVSAHVVPILVGQAHFSAQGWVFPTVRAAPQCHQSPAWNPSCCVQLPQSTELPMAPGATRNGCQCWTFPLSCIERKGCPKECYLEPGMKEIN